MDYYSGLLVQLISRPVNYFTSKSSEPINNVGEVEVRQGDVPISSCNNYLNSVNVEVLTTENINSESSGNSINSEGRDNKIRRFKKSNKMLTTCRTCGHYRFARRNTKRIVNSEYPYEHSPKGGCNIPKCLHVPPGQKLRRVCLCEYCKTASSLFNHNPVQNKKQC
jgi:hypothetical protein